MNSNPDPSNLLDDKNSVVQASQGETFMMNDSEELVRSINEQPTVGPKRLLPVIG